jgi:Cysteine dioxygenase type I
MELIEMSCHDHRVQHTTTTRQRSLTPKQLAARVQQFLAAPADWVARVRLDLHGRWYEQIRLADDYEVWLISWMPGQSTGFHDHGGTNGAFGVATPLVNRVSSGTVRSFGPRHVHDVTNSSPSTVAVSVHAYSPPLSSMTRYNLTPAGLTATSTEGQDDW